jgi:hypothetical protein
MSKEQTEINSELSKLSKVSIEDLNKIQNIDKSQPQKELTGEDVKDVLSKMNPKLAQFLVIETLESEFVKSRHGAFPSSSAHQIKDLINNKYSEFNGIENNVERLESLSINLVHEKVRNKIKFEPKLDQSNFISDNLTKRLNSFSLLPNHLQEGIESNFTQMKRKLK